jgi:hypothetical protein
MNGNARFPVGGWKFVTAVAVAYVLTGLVWLGFGSYEGPFAYTARAVQLLFPTILIASAAAAAVRADRLWALSGPATAATAFLLGWIALLLIELLPFTDRMLGCRMHEVWEGGLPDAVCAGPLLLFSSGRRAWTRLPHVVLIVVIIALVIALLARGVRFVVRRTRASYLTMS